MTFIIRYLLIFCFKPETGWFPSAILKNRSLWRQKLSNKRKTFVSSSNWISQPKWYWKEEEGIEKESWVENCLSIEKFFLFAVTILEHHLSSFPLSNSFTLLGFPNWWNNKPLHDKILWKSPWHHLSPDNKQQQSCSLDHWSSISWSKIWQSIP